MSEPDSLKRQPCQGDTGATSQGPAGSVGAGTMVAGAPAGALCVWLGFTLVSKPLSSLDALTFYVGASFIISGIGRADGARTGPAPAAWPWAGGGSRPVPWCCSGRVAPWLCCRFLRRCTDCLGRDPRHRRRQGPGEPADDRLAALVFALADLILGVAGTGLAGRDAVGCGCPFRRADPDLWPGPDLDCPRSARTGRRRAAAPAKPASSGAGCVLPAHCCHWRWPWRQRG